MVIEILAKIKLLEDFIYIGAPLDKAYEGFRSLVAGKGSYRLIYRIIDDDIVEIAYIRHCRRQMGLRIV